VSGAEVFIIAAADTASDRPNAELLAACFPSVEVRDGVGDHDTLLGIDKARRLLGYEPAYSWRDAIAVPAAAGDSRTERR
jgi:nucleoside-diphosphate-sugar epimerase